MMYDLLVERMLNGLAKNKTIKDLAKKHKISLAILKSQLKKGINVEKEHTKNSNVAKKIAMDHLFEDPKYYTNLKKIEKTKRNR